MRTLLAAPLLVFSLAAPAVGAADLSIALGGDVTSMDPHFHNLTPNNNIGAERLQCVADEVNKLEVRVPAHGGKRDEPAQHLHARRQPGGTRLHDHSRL